jgi:hypothetical protein
MAPTRGFLGPLLCWLGFHVIPDGTDPSMAIAWCCDRCDQIVPGGLSARHKRRRKW